MILNYVGGHRNGAKRDTIDVGKDKTPQDLVTDRIRLWETLRYLFLVTEEYARGLMPSELVCISNPPPPTTLAQTQLNSCKLLAYYLSIPANVKLIFVNLL